MNNFESNDLNNYSFNFNKFKELKKKLNIYFIEKYWKTINQKFKDKKIREAIFKYILGFSWNTDLFNSWRKENINDFELPEDIIEIINDLKNYTKKILYTE